MVIKNKRKKKKYSIKSCSDQLIILGLITVHLFIADQKILQKFRYVRNCLIEKVFEYL